MIMFIIIIDQIKLIKKIIIHFYTIFGLNNFNLWKNMIQRKISNHFQMEDIIIFNFNHRFLLC